MADSYDCDYLIVGSGFGGSVSALRLSEKGYKVLVVEAGKRWKTEDFPKTNWNVRKFLWLPSLFCYGIQRLTLLRDVLVGDKPGEKVGDPFFGGAGPDRVTCTYCGGCMIGCRHGAKNTLDKNYLF